MRIIALVASLALAGCECAPKVAATASPCAPAAALPAASPCGTPVYRSPCGESSVRAYPSQTDAVGGSTVRLATPDEVLPVVGAIPVNVVVCVWNGLTCVLHSLFPFLPPAAHLSKVTF